MMTEEEGTSKEGYALFVISPMLTVRQSSDSNIVVLAHLHTHGLLANSNISNNNNQQQQQCLATSTTTSTSTQKRDRGEAHDPKRPRTSVGHMHTPWAGYEWHSEAKQGKQESTLEEAQDSLSNVRELLRDSSVQLLKAQRRGKLLSEVILEEEAFVLNEVDSSEDVKLLDINDEMIQKADSVIRLLSYHHHANP
ncbi:hypothetical protein DIPPA_22363 [Diplonema papillatum]|nr:hypothetical protein DIPPA_22363 [Diplonema papillatum]